MLRILIIIIGVSFIISCKNPPSTSSAYTAGLPENVALKIPEGFSSFGIDQNTIQLIINSADHIDYMFNTMPLSMNQEGTQAILRDMSLISSLPIEGIPETCQPLARKIYYGEGEILIEADIYFTQECTFQIFIKDEKPLFGNLLTIEGINFYNNLLSEADRTMPEKYRN